jgi:ubiquinone biosynthesis protein
LIDERKFAALLPGEYARLAGPVREALIVFLSGLPRAWQDEIVTRQMTLGPGATLAERLGQLAHCCPVLHKLGQMLARDRRLAPALRDQLKPLETLASDIPWQAVESQLDRELGPLAKRGVEIVPPVLAEASVAFVVAFQTSGREDAPGVFKLLKPGIAERLEVEVDQLGAVGACLDESCRQGDVPQLDYQESFEEVRTRLISEVQLDEEQRNLATACRLYAGERGVHIPRLMPALSTPRVIAMERIFGVKVTEHQLRSGAAQRRLARTAVRVFVACPMFARGDAAIYHCDPHAGNLMHTSDDRLAILDWSLAARLTEPDRTALTQIVLAAVMFDSTKLAELIAGLGVRGVDRSALEGIVRRWLQRCRQGQFPGLVWLLGLLDDAALNAGLRVSAEMMLFRKSMLTLEGVLADLAVDEYGLDMAVATELMAQFTSELPGRWLAPLGSRQFATRIANSDLIELGCTWPLAAIRLWRGAWPMSGTA